MGSIKDRNGSDLTEAEDIKKRWQDYTEGLYKKDLHAHDGVITDLEPDILECEVKWALGSITTNKASGDDGIPAELFQILKDDADKVLHSICRQIWKTKQWPQDWKRFSFHSNPKERQYQRTFKLPYSCTHFTSYQGNISSISFKLGFNSTSTKDFQMFKLDLEKAEESEIKLPTSAES